MSAFRLLLLTLLITTPAEACDCIWRGPFSRAQASADLIVTGEVTAQRGNGISLRVGRTLRGELFADSVQVWGAYGDSCRPDAAQFEPGSQWVMALSRIETVPTDGFDPDTPNRSYGLVGDYTLDSCGVTWLQLRDGMVTGNLTGSERWQYEANGTEPVLLELLEAFLRGQLPEAGLAEATKPLPGLQQLRSRTRGHLMNP